ncbi:MAG: cupin domain-containing protein [Caldilinea sp.]|uniref:cupin domain-containing protein n=1 Tax=Caldilinea sp. TaxID=2293560 RepID=UPI002C8F29E1|nr:cupin domain-containing protein [Anaerolineales bacterium]HQY92733.1 cupin domain-containing protein [Caldilinea sp.]
MSETMTMQTIFFPSVEKQVIFGEDGPRPQFLVDSEKLKVLVAGLEPGQQIPTHPETLAVYYFLEGEGVMTVNHEEFAVTAGSTIVTPLGAARGMRATTRLIFLAAKS